MHFDILTTEAAPADTATVALPNDADAYQLELHGIERIALDFPKFSDGRAFSQAVVLRRRGFAGDIRARGDVLIDQLSQLQRCGFSSAVLRADQDAAHGQTLLSQYGRYYQGDASGAKPLFAQS
jgi:uncharacterized protein (DUF934 family)